MHKKKNICDDLGREDKFPAVKWDVKCKYFKGWTDVVVVPLKFASVLIGNVRKSVDLNPEKKTTPQPIVNQVTMTSSSVLEKNCTTPLKTPHLVPTEITHEKFIELQNCCLTLENVRKSIVNQNERRI